MRSSIAPAARCSTSRATRVLAASHVIGSKSATLRACQRPLRRGLAVSVRADVNWDAFRSANELGRASSADRTNQRPSTAWTVPGGSVQQVDFLVIGSGIAGLSYALKVAEYGTVAVVTKDFANEGCTQYAQGGVCAVLDRNDSVQEHVRDTIIAGAHLNDPQ